MLPNYMHILDEREGRGVLGEEVRREFCRRFTQKNTAYCTMTNNPPIGGRV